MAKHKCRRILQVYFPLLPGKTGCIRHARREKSGMNPRKAAIIGCGNVGASIAFSLMQQALFSELVLIDADARRAQGEAMDLSHGLPYAASMDIRAGGYGDVGDCALIIVTAGASQREGETRLDLIGKNLRILGSIVEALRRTPFSGILLIVANPVDVLTCEAQRLSGYPASRVIGSGTVLDSARLKQLLGRRLQVDSRSVHAVIIGEHGDSELPVWSGANVSGIDLAHFFALRGFADCRTQLKQIEEDVRRSAYAIIERKGATYYGIAMAVARIAAAIIRDEHAVLPISTVLGGEYGLSGLALSVPAVVGRHGVEAVLEIPLDDREREGLLASAAQLAEVLASAER